MYFLLGFVIVQTIAIVWLLLKIKDLVNEIKRYQYTNNLKLIGYLEKRLNKSAKHQAPRTKYKGYKND